jgi:hypothetical protein
MATIRRSPRQLLASFFVFSFLAFLPGCQAWNAFLKFWMVPIAEEKKPDKPIAVVSDLGGNGGSNLTQPPGPPAMVPRVIVYRITAPVGTFSGNEKVWSELNEDALDSKMSVLMAQNGLRAGTGNVARWPIIAKVIEGPGASSDQQVCQTDGRSSLNVVTRPGVTDEIVVSIDRDLQQQGRTFEACDNGFRLSMRGIRGKQQLQVQLEPYVALGTVHVQRREGTLGISSGGFVHEESFPDLAMGAILSADQFLVISPVDPKQNRFSVGSLWLSDIDKVPAMETVLIFVPATSAK